MLSEDSLQDYVIRSASVTDSNAVALLIAQTLGDDAHAEWIDKIISGQNRATHILQIGVVAGFIDSFLTTSHVGQLRWEVDLLGVHPAVRGRGFAQDLITQSVEYGRSYGAELARAWVADGNTPAEKAFMACGFKPAAEKHMLLISHESNSTATDCQNSHLISVQTLTYSGIWVEDVRSEADLACGLLARTESGVDLVGTLIPASDGALLETAQIMGFSSVGRYCSFTLKLDVGQEL